MASTDPTRMSALIAQNHRKKRAARLTTEWASHGLAASPLALERYTSLVDKLRSGRSRSPYRTDDLLCEMRSFVVTCDMVTVIGWDLDEEPALLVSAKTLIDKLSATLNIYPDGFILFNDATEQALIVDFDEDEGTQTNLVDLSFC